MVPAPGRKNTTWRPPVSVYATIVSAYVQAHTRARDAQDPFRDEPHSASLSRWLSAALTSAKGRPQELTAILQQSHFYGQPRAKVILQWVSTLDDDWQTLAQELGTTVAETISVAGLLAAADEGTAYGQPASWTGDRIPWTKLTNPDLPARRNVTWTPPVSVFETIVSAYVQAHMRARDAQDPFRDEPHSASLSRWLNAGLGKFARQIQLGDPAIERSIAKRKEPTVARRLQWDAHAHEGWRELAGRLGVPLTAAISAIGELAAAEEAAAHGSPPRWEGQRVPFTQVAKAAR